jgi:hypothetical protein
MNLLDFLPETIKKLESQLIKDQERWGDTWKHRTREGQEERAFARFNDYYDQYINAGVPIPWLKIIGEAHIAMVREDHPEELGKK